MCRDKLDLADLLRFTSGILVYMIIFIFLLNTHKRSNLSLYSKKRNRHRYYIAESKKSSYKFEICKRCY